MMPERIHTTLFVFFPKTASFGETFLTLNMKPRGYLWLLWLLTGAAYAQGDLPPVVVPTFSVDATGEVSLRGKLARFVDSTGQLGIRQVIERQRSGKFRPALSPTDRRDFGYNTTATHWLFFTLEAPATRPQSTGSGVTPLMLEIEYANLDDLELFAVSGSRVQSQGRTGDRFRFSQRPYLNNNYVFPIRLRAGDRTGYYLRLNQRHAILSFFVRLWHRPAFVAADRTEYFLWGIYIGLICIVLVLNLIMLLVLRDWIYLWYSLYLHFITMHLFADAGLAFQYLWPNVPRLNEFSPVYLYVWAAMVAQTTFMQQFIHQTGRNSRVFRWVNGFKAFVTISLLVVIAVHALELPGRERYMYRLVSLGTSAFVPVIVTLSLLSLYERLKRGGPDPMVRYYAYALAVQFAGYGLVATMNFYQGQGWSLFFDVETYVVLGLTVVGDLAFFTYGLAYRYTRAQQRNQQLELNLLRKQQDAQLAVIGSLEDERRRLAQDLHDDIGPLLATAKGYLSRLARGGPPAPLQRAQTLLDEAADELRTLAHQLLPRPAGQVSLDQAIAEACRQAEVRGVPVRFVSAGTVRTLDGQREHLLFSIATQLIRNARHHRATEVTVQLLYHDAHVNLSVEDNGQPADAFTLERANLRAKADLLGADLLIDATDGGNSVMVSVPTVTPQPV